ncbi:hypothetical protein KPH14_013041, partial [Odynerus spinipes]
AIYAPPGQKITLQNWQDHFQSLGDKFISAGDYNAKHTTWGSKIITTRGRTLEEAIRRNSYNVLSTGKPTHWPTDINKKPDVIDFAIVKALNINKFNITSSLDLSSDHTPLIVKYSSKPVCYNPPTTLCNKTTNWETFKTLVEQNTNCNIPLKTPEDIEQAVAALTTTIQEAAWASTSFRQLNTQKRKIPTYILDKIKEKRKVKAKWQKHKTSENKKHLNKITKELKNTIRDYNDDEFKKFLES